MPATRPTSTRSRPASARTILRAIEDPHGETQNVMVNLTECPLQWLRVRGLISERLYLAGDMLRRDWETAGLAPRVTLSWDVSPRGRQMRSAPRGPDLHSFQLSAKRRFDEALRCAGPGLSDVLWRVACAGEGLSAAEQALGWPARAAKLVLGFALERVADYYRIA